MARGARPARPAGRAVAIAKRAEFADTVVDHFFTGAMRCRFSICRTAGAAMIEFDTVSKSFWTGTRRKVILDQASFRVEQGNSLGILAPNGSGKTTIINMMAGLEKPDEGVIRRTGRVSFPLGFMGGVVGKHSANENARYIARLYGLDPDYIEAFCRLLCDLDEYFDQPVATYSAGMKSRLTFALMLALDFDVYLIDEGMPANTDAGFNVRAGALLRERLEKATVVVVSHQPGTLQKFCRSAAVLRDGRLTMFETLEEAKRFYDYAPAA
jgi:capsular polysaccharide transport system ATP-binding protein